MTTTPAPDRKSFARALFAPRTVALVGASADPGKNTGRPQRFLRQHGFRGRVVPINPNQAEVQGEAAYPDLISAAEALGSGSIDHALIMVPAAAVATVYSDGFAEAGPEGRARE